MGELNTIDGTIIRKGRMNYSPQEPWVFGDTIRENVIFGETIDLGKLQKVYEASKLIEDIGKFPLRDQTIVGERGLRVSGGQRARISLARALYRDSDLFLLDDPLSALDANIGEHVFKHGIKEYLKDKTVLLVTHQTQYLKSVDKSFVISDGVMLEHSVDKEEDVQLSVDSKDVYKVTKHDNDSEKKDYLERTGEGFVNWGVHWYYMKKGSLILLLLGVFFLVVVLVITLLVDKNTAEVIELNYGNYAAYRQALIFYSAGIGFLSMASLGVEFIFAAFNTRAAIQIHADMLKEVIKAKMIFFDSQRIGIILNRFSKDIMAIDHVLFLVFATFIYLVLQLIFSVSFTLYVYPLSGVSFVLSIIAIFIVFKIATKTIFVLKRLSSSSHSPLLSHVSDTIDGLTVIRCHDVQDRFWRKYGEYLDENNRMILALNSSYFWLRTAITSIVFLILMATSIIMLRFTTLSVTLLGLVIQYILHVSEPLQTIFQTFIRMEDAVSLSSLFFLNSYHTVHFFFFPNKTVYLGRTCYRIH